MIPVFRLINRRERWGLSRVGWIVSILSVMVVLVMVLFMIYPFLAVNEPVRGELLVLEGWPPDQNVKDAMSVFKSGGYRLLVTTGGPLSKGYYLSEYKNSAELTAATLEKLGFDKQLVVAVPSLPVKMNRTYASALTLKKWLARSDLSVTAMDVYSQGPHSRRTRMLFEKAFGDGIAIGVIAGEDDSYDGEKWWTTSQGFRVVIGEMIAYLYARLLFCPNSA